MFRWGIIFLVIALIAAALGFGGLAGTAAGQLKLSSLSVSSCSGEPVYGTQTSVANAIFLKQKPVVMTGFFLFALLVGCVTVERK